MLHRLERTIRVRAVDPKKPLPETPNLLKYSTAPKDIVETSRKQREHLIKVADVKKGKPNQYFPLLEQPCIPVHDWILQAL